MGYWKDQARKCITFHLRKAEALGLDHAATVKLVDAAYPWGPRDYYPYQAWLAVRKELLFGVQRQPKQPRGKPSEAEKLRAAGEAGLFDEEAPQ